MQRSLKSYWTNNVQLSPLDRKRLGYFVAQELSYYNRLVEAFAGPLRSMPETFAKTAAHEDVFADCARTSSTVSAQTLDSRLLMLAQVVATPATLHSDVRRNMALAILRECRAQSRALNEAANGAMPNIIETLSPIEASLKRHVQLPRSAIEAKEDGKHDLLVKLPYFTDTIRVSKPNASWNYVYARFDQDDGINVDLAFEDSSYVLRKIDRTRRKGEPHLARRGVR